MDLANILRIAITGRSNAPDIKEVNNCLGEERAAERIRRCISN